MAEPDPSPVLCHLSGNWARVAIDAYTRYTERCPDRTLMQFLATGLHFHEFPDDRGIRTLVQEQFDVPALGCNAKTISTLLLG